MTKIIQKTVAVGVAFMVGFMTATVLAQVKTAAVPEQPAAAVKELPTQVPPQEVLKPQTPQDEAIQRQKEAIKKRYATLDTEKLLKRKEVLSKRLETVKDERHKQHLQLTLEVIDSLLQK